MAADASGAHGRAIFVDAIDEALKVRAHRVARGLDKPKPPRRSRRQLNDIAMRQLRQAEKVQRMMARQIGLVADEKDDSGKQVGCVSADFIESFNKLTATIAQLMEQIRRGEKLEREKFGGLTEDQMDEVFKQQLQRIGPRIEDYDRFVLLTAWYGEEIARLLTGTPAEAGGAAGTEARE